MQRTLASSSDCIETDTKAEIADRIIDVAMPHTVFTISPRQPRQPQRTRCRSYAGEVERLAFHMRSISLQCYHPDTSQRGRNGSPAPTNENSGGVLVPYYIRGRRLSMPRATHSSYSPQLRPIKQPWKRRCQQIGATQCAGGKRQLVASSFDRPRHTTQYPGRHRRQHISLYHRFHVDVTTQRPTYRPFVSSFDPHPHRLTLNMTAGFFSMGVHHRRRPFPII